MTLARFRTAFGQLKRMARPAGTAVAVAVDRCHLILGMRLAQSLHSRPVTIPAHRCRVLGGFSRRISSGRGRCGLWPRSIGLCSCSIKVGSKQSCWLAASRRQRPGGHFCAAQPLLGIGVAEVSAAAWLGWLHRLPALPVRFARAELNPDNEVFIVVIGESSALGVPYDDWLSVGAIVGRELERVIPSRRFRVRDPGRKGSDTGGDAPEARRIDAPARRADRLLRAQ